MGVEKAADPQHSKEEVSLPSIVPLDVRTDTRGQLTVSRYLHTRREGTAGCAVAAFVDDFVKRHAENNANDGCAGFQGGEVYDAPSVVAEVTEESRKPTTPEATSVALEMSRQSRLYSTLWLQV